jgi:outer membrane usher protein
LAPAAFNEKGLKWAARSIAAAVALGSSAVCSANAGGLPSSPSTPPDDAAMDLHLELVINGRSTGSIVFVRKRLGSTLVQTLDLQAAGISLPDASGEYADVEKLQGAQAVYSAADQKLFLTVPPDWLPTQIIARDGPRAERLQPSSSFGALINYDLYLADSPSGSFGSLWNEARLFGDFGIVRNTGNYRFGLSGPDKRQDYIRYDTSWIYIDDERIHTYEAGDFVTRTLAWSSPVRMGGFQLSRDFTVRPDIITYPTPRFSGSAAVPSAVDLYVNGYRALASSVQPGPFTLNEQPYVNGAGEAVVVTTDAQGRRVSTAIPFYVANTLLRPGLADYAFSAGKLRRRYGLANFSYGEMAGTAAIRWGVNDLLTLEATAEAADEHALGGIGGLLRIENLGVVDASASHSRQHGRNGQQYSLGYQYNGRRFNLMARSIFRSTGFGDLSTYEANNYRLPTRQIQAQANVVLGKRLGNVGAGYIEARQRDYRFRLLTFSYYRALWGNSSLYLSASRELGRGRTSAMLQFIIPFGTYGTGVAGLERAPGGSTRATVNYSRAVPSEGGLGWTVAGSHSHADADQYQADATWRNAVLQLRGGAYGSRGNRTIWGEAAGSLVLMDGGAFLANRISDAFVLLSTDGVADVPVHYENQPLGKTDRNGHFLVPWVPSYYPAKFGIDPIELPTDMKIPFVEQRAAVKNGSGTLVRFPITRTVAANIDLRFPNGKTLPAGTEIRTSEGGVTWVGMDGSAYLEDLLPFNRLTAALANGQSCMASFSFDTNRKGIGHIGPVECR